MLAILNVLLVYPGFAKESFLYKFDHENLKKKRSGSIIFDRV